MRYNGTSLAVQLRPRVNTVSQHERLLYDWESACSHLCQVDPVLNALIGQFGDSRLTPRGDLFYTLVRAIVGQQVSVAAADSIWERMLSAAGKVQPSALLACPPQELLSAGLSRRKVEYITGLARDSDILEQTDWSSLDDEAAIERLVAFKGIGRWTAEMALLFSLHRPNVLPLADIGLLRALQNLYFDGVRPSAEQALALARPWEPWRSVATWFLWRSVDPEIVAY